MSFKDYLLAGWRLCNVPPGFKGPQGQGSRGWNTKEKAITDPSWGSSMVGAGLLHAYSGTCAVDIDKYDTAREWLAERGIDLDALMTAPDAVMISSGRQGRGKLLYRLANPMASVKLAEYTATSPKTGKPQKYHGFELRCATADGLTVQDIVPPTLHPETGRSYEWRYGDPLLGHWSNLPELPAPLLALWEASLAAQPEPAGPTAPLGAIPAEIEALLVGFDPDGTYDDWIEVGMALHHETKGAGLEYWHQWSMRGAKYKGRADLEQHWRSFRSDTANAVTFATLRSKSVAAVTDFEPVTTTPGEKADVGEDMRVDAVMQRIVGDNVVYVRNLDSYFDKRERIIFDSDRAVRNAFCPDIPAFVRETKKGKETFSVDPVTWLMRSKSRKAADVYGVAMHPGMPVVFEERGKRYANGFSVAGRRCAMNPAIIARRPTHAEREAFEFVWSRLKDKNFAAWLKKFYAHALQKPGVKIRSAPLLVSEEQGTGKTTITNEIPKLLFGHIEQLTESQLRTTFNGELLHAWWATVEEIYAGHTKQERRYMVDKLKPWITNDDLPINAKGQTAFSIPNRAQFTASSNHPGALQLDDEQERRWGVCGVIEERWTPGQGVSVYNDLLMNPKGVEALKHIFLEESLVGFNPNGAPPVTHAKKVMVVAGLGAWESTMVRMILNGEAPFDRDIVRVKDIIDTVPALGGVSPHVIAGMLKKAPFAMRKLSTLRAKEWFWCWRNYDSWKRVNEKQRLMYLETGKRPANPLDILWSNAIPDGIDLAAGNVPDTDEDPAEIACDALLYGVGSENG